MLVLSRRALEAIRIGDDIRITIQAIGLDKVKIGIDAPPSIRVDREEIFFKIQQDQEQEAAQHADTAP